MPRLKLPSRKRRAAGASAANQQAASADVALVFDHTARECAFAYHSNGRIVVGRSPDTDLREALLDAAAQDGERQGIPKFLTCAPHFTESTSLLALTSELSSLTGDDLLLALADAADTAAPAEQTEGEASAPVIPDAAREPGAVWDYARTPDDRLTLTSCARAALDDVAARIAAAALGYDVVNAADEELYLEFGCETLLRATLRGHFSHVKNPRSQDEGGMPSDAARVSAMVVFAAGGSSVGLWSPTAGLFLEDAEPFRVDESTADTEVLASSVEHALSNLLLRLSPEALRGYGLSGVERVWWAASPRLRSTVAAQMGYFAQDYAEKYATPSSPAGEFSPAFGQGNNDEFAGMVMASRAASRPALDVSEAAAPLEELAALGLLLASEPETAALLPPINLADPATERADAIVEEREQKTEAELAQHRRSVRLAAAAPLVICLGLLFGGYLLTLYQSYSLSKQHEAQTQEQARLVPVAERRKAATEVLKWVSGYLVQVTDLRRRQPASLSLLAELDARYPLAEDDTFTVLNLDAQPDGSVTIQGLTKRDGAVSALITSLEYSPTDSTGKKLFVNPVYDLRKPQVGGVNLPQIPGGQGSLQAMQAQRPDVTAWTVRTIYTPLQVNSAVTPKPQAPPPASQPQGAQPETPADKK